MSVLEPNPAAVDTDAWHQARCRDGAGTLSHLFFADDPHTIARAKAICRRCPLAEICLAGAVVRREPAGVWGGELLVDGVVVAHRRPRGRPPRGGHPPIVVDEVPDPARVA